MYTEPGIAIEHAMGNLFRLSTEQEFCEDTVAVNDDVAVASEDVAKIVLDEVDEYGSKRKLFSWAEDVNEVLAEDVDEVLAEDVNEVLAEDVNEVLAENFDEALAEDVNEVLAEDVDEVLAWSRCVFWSKVDV